MKNQHKIAVSINLDWPLRRYHEVFSGIQAYAKEHTSWILVWDHFPEMILQESTTPFYDGIIGRISYEIDVAAKKLKIPQVNLWISSKVNNVTSVFPDLEKAGKLSAEHLLKRGFRNFVSIDTDDVAADAFYRGFSETITPFNCEMKRYFVSKDLSEDRNLWHEFHKNFIKWASEWKFPLAIASSLSDMSPKIIARCFESNLKVPEDVAFISACNDLTHCEGFSPSTSSVDLDFFKVGYEAARTLHKKLNGEFIPAGITFIEPKGVVARESTDTYSINDEEVKIALRYIANNCQNNIQVNDIVEHVSISRRSLEIRFQKALGISIVEEINRMKVEILKKLLVENNEKVTSFHEKAGFSCPLHMRRVFHKYTGMTPTEYRKANS